jgi:uracil-DNA glycosylase family 4
LQADESRDCEPGRDCALCPRLKLFRDQSRAKEPSWHNAPVESFASSDKAGIRLLVVGLAPGLRGANRTGRPFTGDYAGDLLFATLAKYGFCDGVYAAKPDDGLRLQGCAITNAVRCVPPQNKPLPAEISTCRRYLTATIERFEAAQAIVALGRIAHDSTLRALGARVASAPFAHGGRHDIGTRRIFASYHCSRYNTNTGRLTTAMFESVFADVRQYLDARH